MHPDLQRVVTLQRLDSAAREAEGRVAAEPERQLELDARLEVAAQRVAAAKERLAENQQHRRAVEKDVAVHQGRLSKFRDQLMSVKTNIEYQAVQKEIQFAQAEVKALEDKILERMLEADDLAASVKRLETTLASEQKAVNTDRSQLVEDVASQRASLDRLGVERTDVVSGLDPQVLAIFELVSRRRGGVAVAEARDGICTICHVRLRPQVFNTIRRNDQIMQCDSCQRILFFTPVASAPADAVSQPAP